MQIKLKRKQLGWTGLTPQYHGRQKNLKPFSLSVLSLCLCASVVSIPSNTSAQTKSEAPKAVKAADAPKAGKPADSTKTAKPGDTTTKAVKAADATAKPAKPGDAPAKPADPNAKPADPNAKPGDKPGVVPIVLDHPVSAISALAYSPDGKKVAVGTYGQVAIYDTVTWQPLGITRQIEDAVRALVFSPDGQTLAIGCGLPGREGLALIWDMNAASKPRSYPPQKDTIDAIAFRKDGKGMLCGANDNKVHYFSALPDATGPILDEHNGRVQAVAFSPKENYIFITAGMDRIVKVWDMKTTHTVVNFDQSEGGVTGLTFINEGQFVGSSLDGKLYWWGVGYDEKKHTYGGYHFRTVGAHDGGVFALARSEDGKRLITCGADRRVMVWNTDGGGIREFKDLTKPMYAVALSPDGKTAVAGGREGVLYIWDVDGNKLLNNLLPPELPKPPAPKPAPVKSSAPAPKTKVAHTKRS